MTVMYDKLMIIIDDKKFSNIHVGNKLITFDFMNRKIKRL